MSDNDEVGFEKKRNIFFTAMNANGWDHRLAKEANMAVGPPLILVNRKRLLLDSYQNVMVNLMGCQLRCKLKVKFVNEDGVDVHGLLVDWITCLGGAFLECGMLFVMDTEVGGAILLKNTLPHAYQLYRFFGRFLGILLVHGYTLDFTLSLPLVKLIQGRRVGIKDIKNDETTYNSIKWLISVGKKEFEDVAGKFRFFDLR